MTTELREFRDFSRGASLHQISIEMPAAKRQYEQNYQNIKDKIQSIHKDGLYIVNLSQSEVNKLSARVLELKQVTASLDQKIQNVRAAKMLHINTPAIGTRIKSSYMNSLVHLLDSLTKQKVHLEKKLFVYNHVKPLTDVVDSIDYKLRCFFLDTKKGTNATQIHLLNHHLLTELNKANQELQSVLKNLEKVKEKAIEM